MLKVTKSDNFVAGLKYANFGRIKFVHGEHYFTIVTKICEKIFSATCKNGFFMVKDKRKIDSTHSRSMKTLP